MNTRFCTHLSSASSFKSLIPPEIKDYNLNISPTMRVRLDDAGWVFDELNKRLQISDDEDIKRALKKFVVVVGRRFKATD